MVARATITQKISVSDISHSSPEVPHNTGSNFRESSSMQASPLLGPVMALVLWTAVMWFWMYATRIPAIVGMKMRMDPNAPRGEQMSQLPAKVRWKADNYNHLF